MSKQSFIPTTGEPAGETGNTGVSRSLRIVVISLLMLVLTLGVVKLVIHPPMDPIGYLVWGMAVFFIVSYRLTRGKMSRLAGFLLVMATWIPLTAMAWTREGVRDAAVIGYIIPLFIALIITSFWHSLVIFVLSASSVWILFITRGEQLTAPVTGALLNYSLDYTIILCMVMILLYLNRINNLFLSGNNSKRSRDKINPEILLHESEQVRRAIFDLSLGYTGLLDSRGLILDFNRTGLEMMGVNLAEIKNRYFWELYPEGIQNVIRESVRKASRGELVRKEISYHDKSGKTRVIDFSLRPFLGEKGEVIYLIPEGCDITGHKKAEEAIIKSELQFRTLYEKASDGILYLSLDGEILQVNESYANMHGYTVEELWNMKSRDHITGNLNFLAPGGIREMVKGEDARFEVQHFHKEGHAIILEVSACLLQMEEESFIVAFHRDITKRKSAEEALKLSFERTRREQSAVATIAASSHLASGNVRELACQITELAAKAINVERVGVWLLDENDKSLKCADMYVKSPDLHSSDEIFHFNKLAKGVVDFRTTRYQAVSNAVADPLLADLVDLYLRPLHISSVLNGFIFVSNMEKSMGVLSIEHVGKERTWEADEISFTCQLADQVALAILNQKSRVTENELKNKSKLQELLLRMATTYINLPLVSVEPAIRASLGEIGVVLGAQGLFIFNYDWHKMTVTATNEWTSEGMEPRVTGFYSSRISSLKEWDISAHLRGEPIFISDTSSIPDAKLRQLFSRANRSSLLSVPLCRAGECHGFVAVTWSEPHYFFTEDELNTLKVFCLMVVNVMIRKQADEKLKLSEERFRELVENMNDVFFTLNPDGIITYISPQVRRLYNYKPENLIGQPFSEIIFPEDKDALYYKFHETLANQMTSREFRFRSHDGQLRWANTTIGPIMENDMVVGIRGLFSDITERKLTENELRKLSLAVEQSPASIIITNLRGGIEYVNPRFTQLTGYTSDEVIGKTPSILKSGKTTDETYKDLWQKISTGNEWRGELLNKKKNGEYFWEAASVSPIFDNDGRISHYLAVKEDITEKKGATKLIFDKIIETEEKERLRYSNELHDGLGPIISTIKLYFQLLAENTESEQKDTIISKASNCIEEAIQTIKEISHNLSPNVLNNFGVVAGLQNFINRLKETAIFSIDFNCNISRRFERNIEITIYRIVTELINNTIKYAGASVVKIDFNFSKKTSMLTLVYTDNGCGFDITEKMQNQKGLGLSNIFQRVATINGKINFLTKPGEGTKVLIEVEVLD
jgi:PAS domain S-box-containing protein